MSHVLKSATSPQHSLHIHAGLGRIALVGSPSVPLPLSPSLPLYFSPSLLLSFSPSLLFARDKQTVNARQRQWPISWVGGLRDRAQTSWTHEWACDSFSSHQLRQFVCRESILFFISRLPADFWSLAHPYCSLSFRICARASSTCARH